MRKYTFLFLIGLAIIFSGCAAEKKHEKIPEKQKDTTSVDTLLIKEFYGYVNNVLDVNGKQVIVIDTVEWLSGREAAKQLKDDQRSGLTNKHELENDLYIRNIKQDSLSIILNLNTEIRMQTFSHDSASGAYRFNEKIKVGQFFDLMKREIDRFRLTPFRFTISGKEAEMIKEIYLP